MNKKALSIGAAALGLSVAAGATSAFAATADESMNSIFSSEEERDAVEQDIKDAAYNTLNFSIHQSFHYLLLF